MQERLIINTIPTTPLITQENSAVLLDMLRLDLVHPVISGNKWFKLKYNLLFAKENLYNTILTFGGAYSNHLVATAAAAKLHDLKSIGIVRGQYAQSKLTSSLQACKDMGMELQFVDREAYNRKDDAEWLEELRTLYSKPYIIPEGGNNALGIKGSEEIARYIPRGYTHVALSVGTGTTFIGLRNVVDEHINFVGFVPMNGGNYLAQELHPNKGNWTLVDDYHFGGFGKWNDDLVDFMNVFYNTHGVPLDMVYTGKMLYGLRQMMQNDYFDRGSKILCIHTGGLQGNLSIADRLCFKIPR